MNRFGYFITATELLDRKQWYKINNYDMWDTVAVWYR